MNATRTTAEAMTSRDEAWKYTPVKEILARVRTAANATGVVGDGLSRSTIDALAGNLFGPRVVFVNGFFASDLSDIDPGGAAPPTLHQSGSPNRSPVDRRPTACRHEHRAPRRGHRDD